jgi:prepilin-type N-terminal cleavage/methylation domain-containing protein
VRERARGFTLVELMIVLTVIVIIATIAIPSLIAARLTANESAAIAVLRSISTAQAQFRTSGKADEDEDGAGEYGTLGELSGVAGVRMGRAKVPTDLTGSMRKVTDAGEIDRSGYVFRLYLPDPDGHGVNDKSGGGIDPDVADPNYAEQTWCAYAWPVRYGVSGRRTFFVSQHGDILFTDSKIYDGPNCAALHAGNAFLTADNESIIGRTAVGTRGADGNPWRSAD